LGLSSFNSLFSDWVGKMNDRLERPKAEISLSAFAAFLKFAVARSLLFAIAIIVLFAVMISALDYAQVQRNRVGTTRYATLAELKEVLDLCGVKNPTVKSPANFLPFQGLAWHGYQAYPEEALPCFKQRLTNRGLVAGAYAEID